MTRQVPGEDDASLRARSLLQQARSAAELRAAQAVLFIDQYRLTLSQTAAMLGCSSATVSRLRSRLKAAPAAEIAARQGWGGRRRQNLSPQEEHRFLYALLDKAEGAGMVALPLIWQEYQSWLGHAVPTSTVYRLLQRHGWRRAARGLYRPDPDGRNGAPARPKPAAWADAETYGASAARGRRRG